MRKMFLLGFAIFFNSCSLLNSDFDSLSMAGASAVAVRQSLAMVSAINDIVKVDTLENCTGGGTVDIVANTTTGEIKENFQSCKLQKLEVNNCIGNTDIEVTGNVVVNGTSIVGHLKVSSAGHEKECDIDIDSYGDGSFSGTACGEEVDSDTLYDEDYVDTYCSAFGLSSGIDIDL